MSNETKQTAVDWYISKIKEARNLCYDASMEMDIGHTLEVLIKKGEQAKEMENKRMMQCYSDGLGNGIAVGREECSFESVADEKEYLIRTYGGNK
jgi:hypothetical protein